MNAWLLVGIIPAILYGLWMLLDVVFRQIKNYQRLSAAEDRRGGPEQAEEKVA